MHALSYNEGGAYDAAQHAIYALGAPASDAQAALACCRDLMAMLPHDERRGEACDALAQVGIFEAAVAALRWHAGEARVQHAVCVLLAALCGQDATRACAAGAVEAVTAAMIAYPEDLPVQWACCASLKEFCCNSADGTLRSGAAGATELLIPALRRLGSELDFAQAGCMLLRCLCAAADTRARALVAGSLQAVLALLRHHTSDESVQLFGCIALELMCRRDAAQAAQAAALGAIEAVIAALVAHAASSDIQLYCATALLSVCPDAASISRAVDAGALDALVAAMGTHRASDEVQAGIFTSLAYFFVHAADPVRLGATPGLLLAVMYVMRAHATHSVPAAFIQKNGCLVIQKFCSAAPLAEAACRGGAIKTIADALRAYPADARVQQHGYAALSALTAYDAAHAQRALRAGVLQLQMQCSAPESMQARAELVRCLQQRGDGIGLLQAAPAPPAVPSSQAAAAARGGAAGDFGSAFGAAGGAPSAVPSTKASRRKEREDAKEEAKKLAAAARTAAAAAPPAAAVPRPAAAAAPSGAPVAARAAPPQPPRPVPAPQPQPARPAAPDPLAAALAALSALEAQTQCVVCLDGLRCTAIFPCRHLVLCGAPKCADMLGKPPLCPMCRAPVTQLVKMIL
jgi:hypothetical protein